MFTRIAECRYVGQGFELRAELPRESLSAANVAIAIGNFYAAHKQVYGHAFDDQQVEVITLRVVATAAVEPLRLPDLPAGGRTDPEAARAYVRETIFDDGKVTPTPRYMRAKLLDGDIVNGPALIVQHNSTTLLPPGYRACVLSHGDLHMSRR
jgi:N-methylhydantoinase A